MVIKLISALSTFKIHGAFLLPLWFCRLGELSKVHMAHLALTTEADQHQQVSLLFKEEMGAFDGERLHSSLSPLLTAM